MKLHPLIRCSAVFTFIVAAVAFAESPDVAAALADRAKLPPEQWGSTYYLTLRPHTGQQRTDLERAIKLLVASDSSQPILERCVPVHVSETLLRINIDDLRWSYDDWRTVAYTRNPYCPKGDIPLVMRADHLMAQLADAREFDSYTRLMFGGTNLPKTKGDVFKFFGISAEPKQTFGFIEGQSGVSVQGTRLIESFGIPRTFAWVTSDVLKLDKRRDPLENLTGFTPDGQEGIVGLFKLSTTTGDLCALNWYWLNNGKGEIVAEAPGNLVRANPPFRHAEIITQPGACIQCHTLGSIAFSRNEFKEFVKSGANTYTTDTTRRDIEAKLLTNLNQELTQASSQYTLAVTLTCGCPAVDASKSFTAALEEYDAPLTLEKTAAELGVSHVEWTRTLALNGALPARLASLPHGGTIPRAAWEEAYNAAYVAANGGGTIVEPATVKAPVVIKPLEKPVAKPVTKPQQRSGGRR